MGYHFLLQGLTQGSNPSLLHCGQILEEPDKCYDDDNGEKSEEYFVVLDQHVVHSSDNHSFFPFGCFVCFFMLFVFLRTLLFINVYQPASFFNRLASKRRVLSSSTIIF